MAGAARAMVAGFSGEDQGLTEQKREEGKLVSHGGVCSSDRRSSSSYIMLSVPALRRKSATSVASLSRP
jgi:hypothetical protein